MKSQTHVAHTYEFCFPELDTLVLVEELPGEVLIRATRNTFTEARKVAFLRELAQEGFIPDEYGWTNGALPPRVRWLIDYKWLTLHPSLRFTSDRIMRRILAGGLVAWLAMLGALFLTHH